LTPAIVIRPALFFRAAVLVGFAIGFGLAFGLRAPFRLGPFVARPRFRLAPMPFAFFPLARLTGVTLRAFTVLTLTSLASVTFRPIPSLPLARRGLTRLAIARLPSFAFSRFCFACTALTRGRLLRLSRATVALRSLFRLARTAFPLRGFCCFPGAPFACRSLVGVTRRALPCFRFARRGFPAMTLAGFALLTRLAFTRGLFRLPRLPCARFGFGCLACCLRILRGLRFSCGLRLTYASGFGLGGCRRTVARNGAATRRSRLACCLCIACRLRVSSGLRFSGGFGGAVAAAGGFGLGGRERAVTGDGHAT
jgi:hypothetical protein